MDTDSFYYFFHRNFPVAFNKNVFENVTCHFQRNRNRGETGISPYSYQITF